MYLFVVNAEEYDASVGEEGSERWSCCKDTTVGDHALVYVTGEGITFEWAVTSPAEKDPKWRYMCRVRRVREFHPPITIQEIRETVQREVWRAPYTNFRGFRAIRIPDEAVKALWVLRTTGNAV
jgi:hypothetical protein